MTLLERMAESTPFNKDLFLEGIERGIRHLHSLGIVHNDINPYNIMFDELDRAVIIDFDSWQKNGQEFGRSKGTSGWMIEGAEYSLFENDIFGLSKMQEYIYNPSSWDPLNPLGMSTSAKSSQTSTSPTSTGGLRDVSDPFGTAPESPVDGDKQNITTPVPATAQGEGKTKQVLGLGQD
ncbi:uncharacterized protein CPUR_08160 [Claviceps purpurea 20.1]|uniref:Protein kinase domain-containing protein n=1 Tax=Claviceps purpurea (strain 20.1) TaxID=1111077 RepID=M1WG44_CLAP2|nr:uncharacterized protein CPUR_08160 [Claviceps purpurea 20.1]